MYERKGCQIVIGIVMLLVMLGFIGPMFLRGNQTSSNGQPILPIVVVDGKAATTDDLNALRGQSEGRPAPASPREFFDRQAEDLANLVELAAGDSLAAKYNVQPTREHALKSVDESIEQQLMITRIQYQMNGLIKQGATDADFESVFKTQQGMTVAEARQALIDQFTKDRLDNPEKGPLIIRSQAKVAVIERVALSKTPSEADLKKSYQTRAFNRIRIIDPKLTPDEASEKAEKARAALASGKAFKDVYKDTVGGTVPPPTELPMSEIEKNKDYAALKDLKVNEAVVITEFSTPAVFQLVSEKTNLPPDFEKDKAKLIADFGRREASTQVEEELKALKEDKSKVVWKDKEAELIYDLSVELKKSPPNTTPDAYQDILKRIDAVEASETGGTSDKLTVARYVAFEEAYKLSKPDDQKTMKEERAKNLAAALEVQDSASQRLELAEMDKDLKLADEAVESLSKAIENTVTFTPADVKFVDGIETKANDWVKAGFFTEDHLNLVKAALKTWRDDKAAYDKDQAELKAMEEENRKEAEKERKRLEAEAKAEKKKLEEEDKRKEAEAKKNGTAPPKTTGTTGGAVTNTTGTNTTGGTTGTTGTTGGITGLTTGQ
jgi:hypothetical protein